MKKVKVRILTPISGGADVNYDLPEHSYSVGDLVELHPKQAEGWIASGIAVAVEAETTSLPEPEKTVLKSPKRNKSE